jgi:hypothetical protein
MPPTRIRRALAFVLDAAPSWALVWIGAGPVLLALPLVATERVLGIGIFDPAVGGDSVLIAHARIFARGALPWLRVIGVWTLVQVACAALAGASLGKLATGLRVLHDGGRISRGRLVLREIVRDAPGTVVVATCGALAFSGAQLALFSAMALEFALAFVALAWSAARILRNGAARSWLDVVARTRVYRWVADEPG